MIKGKEIRAAVKKAVSIDGKSSSFEIDLFDLTYVIREMEHVLNGLRRENMKYDEAKIVDDWFLRVLQLREEINVYCHEYDKKKDAEKRMQRKQMRKESRK